MSAEAFDLYKQLDTPAGTTLLPCPCCGAESQIWQYAKSADSPATKTVMCSNGDAIGPQESLAGLQDSGCLLYMPPDDFYRATIREAVKYWNEYAKALQAMQRANRWKTAQVLRDTAKEQQP